MATEVASNGAVPTIAVDNEKAAADLSSGLGQVQLDDKTASTPLPNAANAPNEKSAVTEPSVEATRDDARAPELPLSAADGLVKTPLARPLESTVIEPRPVLTTDQEKKYEQLLEAVLKWTDIPETSARGSDSSPLTDSERMWLTRDCLFRYLRATTWNVALAETRLRNTLVWRREYGLEKHTKDYISIENATGKQVILGWDNNGRTCQYLRPSKQNTERSDRQIEHLVFMLERSIDLMPAGQETLALLINFAETQKGQGATLGQGKQTMNILQNHYPERLGRALVTNVPWYIWGFFKLITPFIDPLTRQKIKFNEDMATYVPREQLLQEAGGDVEFEYDHDIYWPAFNGLCEYNRAQRQKRWEEGGKRIGEYEGYLKGGDELSLAARESADGSAVAADAP